VSNDHEADTLRDVAGLYRAVMRDDHDGARFLAASSPCCECLAIETARVALMLAAHLTDDAQMQRYRDNKPQEKADRMLSALLTALLNETSG
jgi:hypothetical protein